MRLINSAIVLASGASLASARSTVYETTIGIGQVSQRQGRFNESNLEDLYSPNSTKSVKFTFGREEWTWRVNITSLSVPDARLDLDSANGPPLPDPRIVMTTFDLQWPNATATLNETAIRLHEQFGANSLATNSSDYDPICMNVVTDPIWPNVTNKLQEDGKDGDCEAVLGQECVAALLSGPLNGGACGNPNLNTPACQGIFNNGYQGVIGSEISAGLGRESGSSNNSTTAMQQTHAGDGVFWTHGRASASPNATALRQAESQLRVMLLTLPNTKALVCTRVDPSINDVDVSPISQNSEWDEGKSSGSGDGDGDSSAAGLRFAVTTTVGCVGIVGLAVAVFGLL